MNQSQLLLKKQLQEITKQSLPGFSAGLQNDDLYTWEIMIIGPEKTPYEGGFFQSILKFPVDYPQKPPTMIFKDMYHPNVHTDGKVCISILHEPGDDRFGYEDSSERWLPIHTVESIVLSVISLLSDPNPDSPANIDCAKEYREDYPLFCKKVKRLVRATLEGC